MKNPIYFEITAYDAVKNAIEFNNSTHDIEEIYEKTLNIKIKGIDKLVLILVEKEEYIFNSPFKMFPFVLIKKKFDFDAYWVANEAERASIVLETLQESVLDMCEKLSLDKAPFEVAYEKLKTGL